MKSSLSIRRFWGKDGRYSGYMKSEALMGAPDEIISNFISLSAAQNVSHFIYFHSCHFHHRVYYKLTMDCSPVGLISFIMDRALRPVSQRSWFDRNLVTRSLVDEAGFVSMGSG